MSSLSVNNEDPNNTKLLVIAIIVTFLGLISINRCKGQDCVSNRINESLINRESYNIQSGSCASPDGSMNSVSSPPPSYAWLNANGYCNSIGPTKTFTVCYTFTSTGSNIDLNAGYSSSGCTFIGFSGFNLYTCNPSCTFIGSGLSFSGLTAGQCYTWCFRGNCTGPGPGFTNICPYWQDVTPLPIELLDFQCFDDKDNIEINWTTASESNNKEFEVQRSRDGLNYEVIACIKAKNRPFKYSINDYFPLNGINYYKLVQSDLNGVKEEFNTIHCNYTGNEIIKEYYNILGEKLLEPNGLYITKLINNNYIKYEKNIKL